jgi:GT2 family glycosyltransferase
MTLEPAREPKQVDATIVIPQHGQTDLTVACVRSLRRAESQIWPIVIVDDGSTVDEHSRLHAALPDVTVIEQPHQGVTRAWNTAAEYIDTQFAVFLNNDTLTASPWMDALLAPLRNRMALLSGIAWRDERAAPPTEARKLPARRFVAGWCCALAVASLREIGGFDESLRLYFSDTDLQARLVCAYGPDCLAVVDDVRNAIRHTGHASTRLLPDRRTIWKEDRRRFIQKWIGR